MDILKPMIRNPRLFFAGIYFTLFKKVFRKNNITIHVPFHLTDLTFRGRFLLNKYEKEEATYLSQHLSPDASVLELGSCLGYVSCLTNKILENKENHVVLEANPNLIEWIEKNKEENNCGFAIENCIISPQRTNEFYIHDLIVGGSTKRKTLNKIEIEGISFLGLQEKHKTRFNTLIMDIEGGELDLFRNYRNDIANFEKIFFEVHPFANILSQEEAQECEDILSALGFHLLLRDGNFQIWEKESVTS